ncbi:transcriptional regulator with XRE-family HTH domain [Aurantimicrobium minutum]|uniref:helix-turn-helix domain-containing protein n=1 Tax=Aurantimicrobium minutum TaxID=708131 RepID=UPI002476C529|nr:helix-turn-helix transcriptional regulator [Aurantimicrobium minutum]MDH6533322.1 transcriptional regulator with XRE-family HTH domain [Aurantimicrobium minutum]
MPLSAFLLDEPEVLALTVVVQLPDNLLSYLITKEGAVDFGHELRRARHERGMSLRRLAELGNTSPAAISQIETGARGVTVDKYNALLMKTRHRLITIPTLAQTPDEVAESIARALDEGYPQKAYRLLIGYSDVLRVLEPSLIAIVTRTKPSSTGDQLYDAALAALVEHWLVASELPLQPWVVAAEYVLPEPLHLAESIFDPVPDPQEVPRAFLSHNVLFPSEALESI